MAGIDKTYIDGKEYPVYRQWWIDNYDKMVKELGEAIYLYPFGYAFKIGTEVTPEFLKNNEGDLHYMKGRFDFPIWNTSESDDKWLVKNCNIQSYRDRMLDVYGNNWKGFKGQKWAKPNKKQKYKR